MINQFSLNRTQMTRIRRIFTDLFSYPRISVQSVQSVFYHNITLNRWHMGEYVGVDDIERFDDEYGRV